VTDPAESVYRCATCGHGEHLTAWAGGNIQGRLGADGELDTYDYVDDWGIYESSIQCTEHADGVMEKLVDGEWCRWWRCETCDGRGRVDVGVNWQKPDGYSCPAPKEMLLSRSPGWYGHEGWRPVSELARA
jgi:hypothetical protein